MKICRTCNGEECVEASSIDDCITGLEKIICAVFDSHGENAVHQKLTEIIWAVKSQIDKMSEFKNLASLDLLLMVDDAAEKVADVKVDFTCHAESSSVREQLPASRVCFRVGKMEEILSGRSCFFSDLHPHFIETHADRLYNLYRHKAGLYPLPKATNVVLYRNKRIGAAMVPFAPVSGRIHAGSAPAESPAVKTEERPKKRARPSDQSTNDPATLQSELKSWLDRGAALLARSRAEEEERQKSEARNEATIQELRVKNETLSELHSVLDGENTQFQTDLEEAIEAQSNLEEKNRGLEAQSITLQTKIEELRAELKSFQKAVVRFQSKDLDTLKEVNKLHSQIGLKSESLVNLQESMEKRLKRGKGTTKQ